ncbi:DUF1329 domain-containing protein [Variovorax boronicumulans]|uniref:DUF1329 domain-containing protein n=1 Tax=Variovorax boronicumulans TaxID=436515 RepID=UPI000BB33A90|nr:DUF1329 domain-containing protein [Variovorax boronicumulans]
MKATRAMATVLAACVGWSSFSLAGVPAEEAARLGKELTPLGAEKAGNKDGAIPAWSGGETREPADFKGTSRRADPYAADKVLYTITGKNYAQYQDKLSDGQVALLKKFPEYRIDVYPTRRSAAAPQWVYDNTFKNATRATTVSNGNAIQGAYGGIPFPIPKTGAEAMWNHLLGWKGTSDRFVFRVHVTTTSGNRVMVGAYQLERQSPYYRKDGPAGDYREEYDLTKLKTLEPPQRAGEAILSRDSLDQVGIGTQSWAYLTGQRRVRKLPSVGYDTPAPMVSGVSNYDEFYNFRGALDRYTWTLAGKREMLIPYNNNGFNVPAQDGDVLLKDFPNPANLRWELHRVWVVEAKLIEGKDHVMPKRRFYLDEDTWIASLADGWDASGKHVKTFQMLTIVAPDLPGLVAGPYMTFNLGTGEWVANHVRNESAYTVDYPATPWSDAYFTSDALASDGVR